MEELFCKGTPAQVARRLLAVLAADPDLLWVTNADGEVWTQDKLDALHFWGRNREIPDSQELVSIMILRGEWPVIGYIIVERVLDRVLVTAENTWLRTEADDAHNIRRSLVEDFGELAPIWEKVKAELIRLGLMIEAEPALALPHGKGGRPRFPEDDYAWEQVNVNHRGRKDVYPEWKERADPDRLKQLADPQDSFNKAVRPSRGRKKDDSE